jgi:hypothetical protein
MDKKAYKIGEAYMDYDCDIRYKLRKRIYRNLDKAIAECKRLNDKIVTKSCSNGYRVFEV